MDIALLFFLPLIGGFFFASNFLLSLYQTAREETQRFYYRAAFYGIGFSCLGGILHYFLLAHSNEYTAAVNFVTSRFLNPLLERPATASTVGFSATAVAARADLAMVCAWGFVLGAVSPYFLNGLLHLTDKLWSFSRVRSKNSFGVALKRPSLLLTLNRRAIKDELEKLLADSLLHESHIQVTLENGKVYVGLVTESLDPASLAKYFKMQPFMSGFRSNDDGRVHFTTFYQDVLEGIDSQVPPELRKSFQLIVPIDKVITASGFNFQAYERFQLCKEPVDADKCEPSQHNATLQGELRVRLIREPKAEPHPQK